MLLGVSTVLSLSRRETEVQIARERVDDGELSPRIGVEKMTLLCFVLDLRCLSPSLVRDLKQALLQLANYYTITPSQNGTLSDRIGLCYFVYNRITSSVELKVAYCPRGTFSLRDFHRAVHNLSADLYCPHADVLGSSCSDMDLSSLLNDQLLYSWGEKDIVKKVVILSSCVIGSIDSIREVLTEATEKCVSVEFLLLEQKYGHLFPSSDDMNNFVQQICDLENCSVNSTSLQDMQVLCGLVKRWLRDLKDDLEEVIRARFTFKSNLFGPVNSVSCNLSSATQQISDDFAQCQTCRCHGRPVDTTLGYKSNWPPSCPVTGCDLRPADLIETSVLIGKNTILFLPSFHNCKSHYQASQPIEFEIFERTRLSSFSEGVIVGAAYYVTPSAFHDIEGSLDDSDKSDLNSQVFHGLCTALNSLDQGLICSSICNVETLKEADFNCYYILLPSENGPMLLRRIAGSEEILPMVDFDLSIDQAMAKEIEDSIHASLGKMTLKDYNPVFFKRGFHQKLNLLVKESLQFGSGSSSTKEEKLKLKVSPPVPSEDRTPNTVVDLTISADEAPENGVPFNGDINENDAHIMEWEQLIVNDVPKTYSPVISSKSKFVPSAAVDNGRQQDPNTSRILERLEIPKQMKSPTITVSTRPCTKKKPLIPYDQSSSVATNINSTACQPLKPIFQKLKRKQK